MTMNELSFWRRVQELLDARRKPLDDPDVQRFLLDNPQHLEEFAELQQGLRVFTSVVSAQRRKRLPVAAAAILALALGLLWLLQPDGPDLVAPDLAYGCRVLEFDIKTVVESRETRTETWVDRSTYIPQTVKTIIYLNPNLNPTHVTRLEIVETRSLTE